MAVPLIALDICWDFSKANRNILLIFFPLATYIIRSERLKPKTVYIDLIKRATLKQAISTREQAKENVIPYCKLANRFKGFGVQMNTSTHKPVTLTILSLHIALAKKTLTTMM